MMTRAGMPTQRPSATTRRRPGARTAGHLVAVMLGWFLGTTAPFVSAAGYDLAELQALIDRKEFEEAVAHLTDVAPTARNAAWNETGVRAILGAADVVGRRDPGEVFEFLRERSLRLPTLGADPRVRAALVAAGIDAVKRRQFYSREGMEAVVRVVLEADPAAIVPLVLDARYDDPAGRLFAWIDRNIDSARGNARLKAVVIERTRAAYWGESAELTRLKQEVLAKTGWAGEARSASTGKLATYAAEMLRGEFVNESAGRTLIKGLAQGTPADDDTRVQFFAPLALMRPMGVTDDPLEQVQSASPAALQRADDALVRSKPETAFWFSGAPWDAQRWARLQRVFPRAAQLAKRECASYRKDNRQEPVHVSTVACEWLQ